MTQNSYPQVTVDGKAAVVIGGTTGIGRAIALSLAENGADVIASSRDQSAVEEIATEIRDRGATTTEITCDITDRDSVETLAETADELFDGTDILVNSAGSVAKSSVETMSEDDWQRDIDVNLTGVFRTIQIFAGRMEEGSIINISSMSSEQARENRPAYCAAKSGIDGLTRAAAADLAPEIRVNAIAPGFVKTPLAGDAFDEGTEIRDEIDRRTPMKRVATPDEIAGLALYLASDAASFTIGECIRVDGGYSPSAL